MSLRIRSNQRSISARVTKAEEKLEKKVEVKLSDIAESLAAKTPVDTGAFASSWNVVPIGSRSGGRSESSRDKPRKQPIGPFQAIAYQNMASDIAGFKLLEGEGVSFVNRAPHARYVGMLNRIIRPTRDAFRGKV